MRPDVSEYGSLSQLPLRSPASKICRGPNLLGAWQRLHEGGFIQVSGADLDDPELRVKRRKASSSPVPQGAELLWEGM
eukprot:s4791_g1.t1